MDAYLTQTDQPESGRKCRLRVADSIDRRNTLPDCPQKQLDGFTQGVKWLLERTSRRTLDSLLGALPESACLYRGFAKP